MPDNKSQSRIYEAAEEIRIEGGKPTVAAVRERARVSNADATRHLRAWRADQSSASARLLPVPVALDARYSVLARRCGQRRTTLAVASHAAMEREWHQVRALYERDNAEVSADLDAANQAAAAATEARTQALKAAEDSLELAKADAPQRSAALGESQLSLLDLQSQLMQERAANEALRETLGEDSP